MNRWLPSQIAAALALLTLLPAVQADKISSTTTVPVLPWSATKTEQKYSNQHDQRTPMMSPLRAGQTSPECGVAPTDEEIRRCLPKQHQAALNNATNVKITKNRLVSRVDEPRFFPLVGMARLHHVHWECTVNFTENIESIYPFPMKWSKDRTCVVYVDQDHLHAVGSTVAQEATTPGEFALVPPQAVVVATVRVADLIDKLEMRQRIMQFSMLGTVTKQLGIELTQVERITFTMGRIDGDAAMMFVMKEPIDLAALLKEHYPDSKKTDHAGHEYYLCAEKSVVLAHVQPRTLLLTTTNEGMQSCIKQLRRNEAHTPELNAALQLAGRHDLFAWADVKALPTTDTFKVPGGVNSLSVGLNVGPRIDLQVRVACDHAQALAWSKKTLQSFTDMVRAHLLLVSAMVSLSDTGLVPNIKSEMGIGAGLPIKLMQVAEKGLQKTLFKTEGLNLTMNATISMNATELRDELLGMLRMLNGDQPLGFPFLMQTYERGMTLPSGQYLQHQPQYFPAEASPAMPPMVVGVIPAPGPLPAQATGPWTSPTPLPPTTPLPPPSLLPPATPLPPATLPAAMPLQPLPSVPSAPTYPVPSVLPPATQPVVPVVVMTPVPPSLLKVTVANVHSSVAHVFELADHGKPTMLEKVAVGQAVDLKLKAGQRYVAVFTDKESGLPTLLTFTAEKTDSIWLLRPSKE